MAESDDLRKTTFLALNWTLYTLCVIFFAARLYIRWICFRRLFTEDYLMVAAMALVTGIEGMGQTYTDTIYNIMAAVNIKYTPPNNDWDAFYELVSSTLAACGSAIILFLIGFYTIKVNFLLFFYRMGNRLLRIYRITWWIVFVIVISCGIVSVCLGVTTFRCLFSGWVYTITTCETKPYEDAYYLYFRVTVALDIITDALIIAFPVWLLWGIRISLRKKIALGGIFSLVGFTIVATILRGALLTEVFTATALGQTFNIPWVWFWFHIEFCIAFIVACLVSFRALFSQNERPRSKTPAYKSGQQQQQQSGSGPQSKPSGLQGDGSKTIVGNSSNNGSRGTLKDAFQKSRFRIFQDSILDTCRTLEGLDDDNETIDMDPLATIDHTRPEVNLELGQIGSFQNMEQGTGQTIPIRTSHDSLENLNHHGAEHDSQGVSVMEEEEEFNAGNDASRRRDTIRSHASQLSLDSLLLNRGGDSGRPSVDTYRRQR